MTPSPDTPARQDAAPDLAALAVDWLDAILASADVDLIGVGNWWPRATSALATACATAAGYGEAVTLAAGKLQIHVISRDSAQRLAALERRIAPVFERWRDETERDAVYIVALTRLKRQSRPGRSRAAHPAPPAAVPAQTTDDEEPLF